VIANTVKYLKKLNQYIYNQKDFRRLIASVAIYMQQLKINFQLLLNLYNCVHHLPLMNVEAGGLLVLKIITE
jgi:hypothetical protein